MKRDIELVEKFMTWVNLLPINWYNNLNMDAFIDFAAISYEEGERMFNRLIEMGYTHLKLELRCKSCGNVWQEVMYNNEFKENYECEVCKALISTEKKYWYNDITYVLNEKILEDNLQIRVASPLEKMRRVHTDTNIVQFRKDETEKMVNKIKVFISYSHKDREIVGELNAHLATLKRQQKIVHWVDGEIEAGQDLDEEIKTNLADANIILLLISANYISSDYCYCKEMNEAIRRHKSGIIRVIPIIAKSCDWSELPFSGLKAIPRDGKAITSWGNQDEAFTDVAQEIRRVVESMTKSY